MPTPDQLALLAFLVGAAALPLDKPATLEIIDGGLEIIVPYDNLAQCLERRERMRKPEIAVCVTDEGEF